MLVSSPTLEQSKNFTIRKGAINGSIEDREIIIDDDTVQEAHLEKKPSPLHIHALNGNRRQLQECIASGAYDINGVDNMGRTPLICSVLVEQIDCVNFLLKSSADIDKPDDDGRTALHWAAYQGNDKLVKLIISKCRNRAKKDKEGRTPLHLSISHDNIKVMQILLKYLNEQEVDTADFKEMTALCWSVSYERIEHTKLLLRHGAAMDKLDNERRSILHWTSQNKSPTLIKLLLDEGCQEINFQDKEGRTLLHMAVGHGNYSIVQFLLTLENIEVNRQDSINVSPLHWAAILGHTAIVELLLNNGANYSLPDNNGARALHYAARATRNNNKDVVAAMINTGKVTDEPDNEQRTALMWAAAEGNFDVVQVLLENQCGNINAVNINQQTALHISCQAGHLKCARLLIKYKADVNMMDKQNRSPLIYACASGYAEIVSLLLSQENQKNLRERDLGGRTPLHFSARVNRRDIIKTLIQHGLDSNAQDNEGCTPLHIAANGGFVHCMNVLLENGAYVNTQNSGGCTALHMASRSGILDAVKLLVSRYNASVNITDFSENHLTCLNYAILEDHQDVAFFLIENGAYIIAALHDKAAKIQAAWRGYWYRKRQAEYQKKSASTRNRTETIVSENVFSETQSSVLNKHTLTAYFNQNHGNVSTLPPVSPTHQVVPPRPASHIGIPSSGFTRSRSTNSLVSGLSSRSSYLSPDKLKYGTDYRQGPKFNEGNTNPFSLNRVSRVKGPTPDPRVNLSPRPRSTTGVIGPVRNSDTVFNSTKDRQTGNMKFPNHFSSRSSTSSSDYRQADRGIPQSVRNPNFLQDIPYSRYGKSETQSIPSASSESTYFRAQTMHRPVPQISLPNDDSSDTPTFSLDRLNPPEYSHIPKPPSHPRKLTPMYTVQPIQHDDNGNKPWNIYRRDQKRINIIRRKTDAAIKIQSAYRQYRARKLQKHIHSYSNGRTTNADRVDENASISVGSEELAGRHTMSDNTYVDSETESVDTMLSCDEIPNEETLQEIAALVIQAAWRQYVKAKLIHEAKRNRVKVKKNEGEALSQESNAITYTYEVKRPKRQLEDNMEVELGTSDEKTALEDVDEMTDSRSRKKSGRGKAKLAPSQSFPLMENIYKTSVRVKRTKRFSIKKRLMRSTSTVTDHSPLENGNLDSLSARELEALKSGKPKLFLGP